MYVSHRLSTVDESNDVWVMEAFENLDFGVEILLQFLIQLREIDRLDCYKSSGRLQI